VGSSPTALTIFNARFDRNGSGKTSLTFCRDHWRRSKVLGQPMSYHVLALTMVQVRQGGLQFQRDLSAVLRESKELKVYSASPFDLDERRRVKDRFGGDVVYFFNDIAYQECLRLGLDVTFIAEVPDDQLPRRRALFVGIPD
jgi:hypothetical protein